MPKLLCTFLLLALTLGLASCNGTPAPVNPNPVESHRDASQKTPLVVFAAGSLIQPFAALEKAFEEKYPNIDVLPEYHGSIQVIRHATELHEPIDIVATADAALIPMLMYATNNPDTDTGQPYADWYIRYASNHLALAYNKDSKYADEINAENWAEILSRPDVRIGIADPRFDAAGYRALMAFALAEERAKRYNLFAPMFDGQFSYGLTIFRDDDLTTITVPEIFESKSGAHVVLRGASIQLIALLQSGDLDYAFEYESVIAQHGLGLLRLPDEVNMGEAAFENLYKSVQVNLDFRRFASVKPEFRGERIGYGITIPLSAPHPGEAALFIAFLLSPEGRAIMDENHHPLFETALADGFANLPENLQALTVPLAEMP
ncbi:MAG: tungstate ABC transporter substrate-binding protein WtpA [Anaerolineae bacterium]|nr:tungstate ABC transporter substrate-binding protein WtpA [Anaerolineae bacterium]